MKQFLLVCIVTLSLGAAAQPSSISYSWQRWTGQTVPTSGVRTIVPSKEAVFSVSANALKTWLQSIGSDVNDAKALELPMPDGTMRRFKVWREAVMEEGLAVRYPGIMTFSGHALGNPGVTVKLDYTDFGFHAMVFDHKGIWFIDPYSNVNDGFYSSYNKKDYQKPVGQLMHCENADAITELLEDVPSAGPKMKTNGLTKKTFRLALACTGEYAVAVAGASPTKAAVLSKMVISLNRVNGVYEREFGVHLNLVSNNDTLIFLNGSTDPYNNSSGGTMMGQNQTTVTSRIGTANYDIGHVFSTGGGGVAFPACVCKSNKAQGVTGSSNPQGDPFDIDYVVHEIGHQFDADHSFNASSGSCAPPNGVSTTAYEPGSGSTIMAYAGICGGGDNLQAHSDAYFHAISLQQISNFLTSPTGATCAANSASGNTPPVLLPFTQSRHIPKLTPFELTAPLVTDPDHDTLTYCWEQWNRGNFGTGWSAQSVTGPIFRSFSPDTSATRIFPRIDKVLAGVTSYLGEKLPDASRFLTFKLTVRDIYNGTGSFNFPDDTVHLDVTANAGPFVVTTPSSAVNWLGNSTEIVTWDIANTDLAPVNCSHVNIYLSVDGGYTFPYPLVLNTPNDGSEPVVVPNVTSTNQARIKVKAEGNVFFNINPTDFVITHNTGIRQVGWQYEFNIFPVPAHEVLHVVSTNNMKLEVHVVNAVGQKIYSAPFMKQLDIPVASFARGLYYVQVVNAVSNEKVVRPVVIN